MARLKHAMTGVVVDVSKAKAERLPREWQPVQSEPKKAPSRRRKSD